MNVTELVSQHFTQPIQCYPVLSSPISHTEATANGPTSDLKIIEEISKTFRRFESIEILICALKRN